MLVHLAVVTEDAPAHQFVWENHFTLHPIEEMVLPLNWPHCVTALDGLMRKVEHAVVLQEPALSIEPGVPPQYESPQLL